MARYSDLDIEYKIATTFSIGMMISGYRYQFENPEHYKIIVDGLNDIRVPPEKVLDLPTLIFMLPAFMTEETAPDVTAIVEQLSATYFVVFRDRLDVLTCSTLILGWARSQCYNPDLLAQMAEQILTKHKEDSFFEPGTESEIANILNGMSGLHYQNEELVDLLHSFLVGPNFKETGELA
jgi:hypothetical protein